MLQIKRSELKQLARNKLGNDSLESQNKILVMISTAMAARTSYTVVGDEKEIDYQKMIELHDKLIEMRHDSPLEHCARVMSDEEYKTFIKGKIIDVGCQKEIYDNGYECSMQFTNDVQGWCRNFKGFIQYRHLIES